MIKKHIVVLKLIEYTFFILIFILYPLINISDSVVISPSFYAIFFSITMSIWLIFSSSTDYYPPVPLSRTPHFTVSMLPKVLITLFMLLVNMSGWVSLDILVFKHSEQSFNVVDKNLGVFFCYFIQFIVAACFEELLFRQYLPRRAKWILKNCNLKSDVLNFAIIEAFPILAFAISHIYLGITGFCNALIAGSILRLLYKRSHSVVPSCITHSVYNLIIFTLSLI